MRAFALLIALLMLLPAAVAAAVDEADPGDTLSVRQLKSRYVRPKPKLTPKREGVYREAVVLKIAQPSRLRLRSSELVSLDRAHDPAELNDLLAEYPGLKISRFFTRPEKALESDKAAGEARTGKELGDLNLYYLIDLREAAGVTPETFVDELNSLDLVELAYQLEKPEQAPLLWELRELREPRDPSFVPEAVGNYQAEQGYLDPAPTGIDAEWAWTLTGGRGSNVRFIDIERQWNLNHDDLPAPFVRIPSTYSVPAPTCDTTVGDCVFATNHGTAVIGEVVSRNNGWGTTGIASSAQFGISRSANGTAWPNVANAINLAAAELSAGDIILYEMHSPGPASGEVCLCNCDQFEFIAMEYWQANYDATVAAVALGIHVVEAAGNGAMDFDDARYGGLFNRAIRDSGAIIVGAGNSANHDLLCFTNFGSRVDFHAWGHNIVTTGYGPRYSEFALTCPPDSNCNDSHDTLFNDDFGGTSGASPIIVGAAAIVEGVSQTKYGTPITPENLRNILAFGATPQGAPAGDNIGPMPNLREVIRADLAPFNPSGWADSIVARSSTGCSAASCDVTPILPGNSTSTYFSFSGRNLGVYETAGFEGRLYVDDILTRSYGWGALTPGAWPAALDSGPLIVRGGRHTVRAFWDYYDSTPEWSETNNADVRQYVWSPRTLTANSPLTRSAPPDRDSTGYSYYNCDGFQATGLGGSNSWWVGTGVLPVNAADDYDVRLHEETPTSTAGFGANVAFSQWGAGQSDFVLVNGNHAGSTGVRWPAVLQGSGTPGTGNAVVEFAVGSLLSPSVGTHGSFSLGAEHILSVHEVYFESAQVGVTYDFDLDNLGSADLGFALYDATGTYFTKLDYMTGGYGDSLGAGGDETFTIEVPASGYYGLAIWKATSADRLLSSSYTVTIEETPPNFLPYAVAGWSAPLVVRDAAGCDTATCLDTPTLLGDSNLSWFNHMGINMGPNPSSGTHRTLYYIDGRDNGYWESPNPVASGGIFYHINFQSLEMLRGGRHTAGIEIDVIDGVEETNENDNAYYEQYVWSPYPLTAGTPLVRSAPPDRNSTGYLWYNCDGYSFNTSWWGATAVMPASSSDNYDVRLHNDYTGSQGGFGANLTWSNDGPGLSDFVMVNGNVVGTGTTWYPGVLQGSNTPAAGNIAVHHVNQRATATPPGIFGGYAIPSNGVISILEFNMNYSAGRTYVFRLLNDSGNADLGFGLYDTAGAHFRKADAMISANGAGNGGDEEFTVMIPQNGYYGLVVWKNDSTDLAATVEYRVEVLEMLPTFVPDGPSAEGIRLFRPPSQSSITVTWMPDCNQNTTTNYSLYVGDLDLLRANGTWDYSAYNPTCNAGQDLMEVIAMPQGNVFILMVPHNFIEEGSYGLGSTGVERPQSTNSCHPQDTSGICM